MQIYYFLEDMETPDRSNRIDELNAAAEKETGWTHQ